MQQGLDLNASFEDGSISKDEFQSRATFTSIPETALFAIRKPAEASIAF